MTPYYADDLVTLYHGDALEVEEWLAADVLVTDPPYGVPGGRVGKHQRGGRQTHADAAWDQVSMRDTVLALWGSRPWLMFGTWKTPRPVTTGQVLVWDKTDGTGPGMGDVSSAFGTSHEEIYLGGRWPKDKFPRRGSVIRTSRAMQSPGGLVAQYGHPTPKPVDLMEILIAACAGVVADPFAGSGSTLVAAKALGRRSIGVELEERYCQIAANRLAQGVLDVAVECDRCGLLSGHPVHLGDGKGSHQYLLPGRVVS